MVRQTRSSSGSNANTKRAMIASATQGLSYVANRLKSPMFISERVAPREEDVITAIEEQLRLPTLDGKTEEEIAASNTEQGRKCVDQSFPPNDTSLYSDPQHPPHPVHAFPAANEVDWKRVTGQLYIPSPSGPRLLQGILDDRWFLGAVAAVATRRDLLLDLLVSDNEADKGLYTFQFYKHGCWHQVVVDDFLPCSQSSPPEVLFGCSSTPGELWPSLLEKAYAKLHGSYFALQGGGIADALVDLTGGVCNKLKLDDAQGREAATAGRLWSLQQQWVRWGYITVAVANARNVADSAEGPGGILLNHSYTIIDARELPDGTRLLRLHNPWPAGAWQGAWCAGSEEWNKPELEDAVRDLESTFKQENTFWIEYWDFIQAFNRLYVTRLFPPNWHQLTLHSSWHGPTTGGPPTDEQGASSSTWCCNPQFRVVARPEPGCGPGELLICLSQRDPTVMNGGHVKKSDLECQIGLMALAAPLDDHGRRWDAKAELVAAESGLCAAREVHISFPMAPETAYTVVPFCDQAGKEGPFVLRSFSSVPVQVEQIPPPLSIVVGGSWQGAMAGGSRESATWGSNPQYLLQVQHRVRAVITLTRMDVKHAIIPPEFDARQCIGMILTRPEAVDGLGPGRRAVIRSDAEVLRETGFTRMDEETLVVDLEVDQPYLLVPSTAEPGVEAPFELRVLSGMPLELLPLPDRKTINLHGAWTQQTAGGSDLAPTWRRNPTFLLQVPVKSRIRVLLSRLGRKWRQNTPLDEMISFYILRAVEDAGGSGRDAGRAHAAGPIVQEAPFAPMNEVSHDFDIAAGQYLIMPTTYAPHKLGRFLLSVSTQAGDFELSPLQ